MHAERLVSAVIPTRGRPEQLARALNSVYCQSYPYLEIVVVVDGPDPRTIQLISSLTDKRLRLISLPASVGGAEARNEGIRASTGHWIAFLDDDDEWLPNKISEQIALALQQECFSTEYFIGGRYLLRSPGAEDQIRPVHLPNDGRHPSEFLLAPGGGFQTSVFFAPRCLFLRVPFKAGQNKHQDLDWFLRMCSDSVPILSVIDPIAVYYEPQEGGSNISTRFDWQFSLAWARSQRSLMSSLAFSHFVSRTCAHDANVQGASIKDRLALSREAIASSPFCLRVYFDLILNNLLSPKVRRRMLMLFRGGSVG